MQTLPLTRHQQIILDAIHAADPHAATGAMVSVRAIYHAVAPDLWEAGDSWLVFERLVWSLVRAGIVAATEYGAHDEPTGPGYMLRDPQGRESLHLGRVRVYHTLSLRQ